MRFSEGYLELDGSILSALRVRSELRKASGVFTSQSIRFYVVSQGCVREPGLIGDRRSSVDYLTGGGSRFVSAVNGSPMSLIE